MGPELIHEMEEKVIQIRQPLNEAQDRKNNYSDAHRVDKNYRVGYAIFIQIRPNQSIIRFGKGTKLSPRFIGPFEILEKVGPVVYHLVLPTHLQKTHNVFHVYFLRH